MSPPLPKKLFSVLKENGEPSFWVECLCVLPSLSPGTKPIRKITFKRGLNIIWSKPANANAKSKKKGAGHAAGKTSLCRALRYVLGENEFGNDFMKAKLQNNKRLYQSYIAAEIWIGEEQWTVARPLNKLNADHAYRNTSILELLAGEAEELSYKEDFLPAIEKATTGRLKVTKLDESRPIVWNHLLEALCRDQETHLASLHQWRNSAANTDPMRTSDADRCFLMRSLFGLAEQKETSLLQKREKIAETNRASERLINTYNQVKNREAAKLGIQEIHDSDGLGPQELFINKIRQDAESHISKKRDELNNAIKALDIPELTETRQNVQDKYNRLCNRFKEVWEQADDLKLQLKAHLKAPEESSEPLDQNAFIKALAKNGGVAGNCGVPFALAKDHCDLFKKCDIPKDQADEAALEFATLAGQLRWQIKAIKQDIQSQLLQLKLAKNPLTEANTALSNSQEKKSNLEHQIRNLPAQVDTQERSARNLIDALDLIAQARTDIADTKETQTELDDNLETIRSGSKKRQKIISNIFNQIIKYLISDDLTGELTFTKIENNATLRRNGELDSAAYRALRCLAYDYAALLSSFTDTKHNCHPRFILHDSPRESDLERGIYQMIFHFLAELEKFAPNSFQTIITTTEDPPEEFQKLPHLRAELSSSPKEMRFYQRDL